MALSQEFLKLTRAERLTHKMLWLAFTFSILMLYAIACALSPTLEKQPVAPETLPAGLFVALAIALVIAARLVSGHFFSGSTLHSIINKELEEQTVAMQRKAVDSNMLSITGALSPSEQHVYKFLPTYLSFLIVTLALHEAIMIVGFISALLRHNADIAFPYLAIAIALNIYNFPNLDKVTEQIQSKCKTM